MTARPLPEDPMIRSLIAQARQAQVNRRTLLAGAGAGAAALALAACAPGGERPSRPRPPTTRPATRRSTGRTGPPTSTRTTTATTRPSCASPRRPASRSTTRSTSTTTTPTTRKVKDQLALGQDIGADTVCLTDWMVAPLDPLRLHAGARPREHPEHREPRPRPAEPRLRPGPQALASVAGRLRRHLLEQGGGPGRPRARSTTCGTPSSRAASACSARCATRWASSCSSRASTSRATGATPSSRPRSTCSASRSTSGQIRNIKGNSYLEDLQNEDTLAAIVLVGRHHGRSTPRPATSGSSRSPRPAARCGTTTSSIPIGSPRKTNAETLINYYYEPEVAAEVAAWVNYITPGRRRQGGGRRRSTRSSPRTS